MLSSMPDLWNYLLLIISCPFLVKGMFLKQQVCLLSSMKFRVNVMKFHVNIMKFSKSRRIILYFKMAIIYLSNENLQREVATRVHIENTLSEANFKKNHVSGKTFASPIIINTLINLSSIFIYLYTHTPEASYNTPKN